MRLPIPAFLAALMLTGCQLDFDNDGYSVGDGDCEPNNADANPGAVEEPGNGIDDNCNGQTDEGSEDPTDTDPPDTDTPPDTDDTGTPPDTDDTGTVPPVDGDGDGATSDEDCDDADPDRFPGNTEECDGVDNDCDGVVPSDETDDDLDGQSECAGDCDDADPTSFTGGTEVADGADNDCDGTTDEGTTAFDDDGDGASEDAGDCDDADADIGPHATDVCDSVDNDCDGELDEDAPTATFYADLDGDGFGDPASSLEDCMVPAGYLTDAQDCDDGEASVNPDGTEVCGDAIDQDCSGADLNCDDVDNDGDGQAESGGDCDDLDATIYDGATEVCDGVDQDCDGTADNGLPAATFYTDADGDGFGDPGTGVVACEVPAGTATNDEDCDDADIYTNPDGSEICDDGIDQDCSGIDLGCDSVDDDYDGQAEDEGDCDDLDASIYDGATEVCDGVDQDCDGTADNGLPTALFYIDADGDGFGDPDMGVESCIVPDDTVTNGDDCDDVLPEANPDGTEVCGNAVDEDCDGLAPVCDPVDTGDTGDTGSDTDTGGSGDTSDTGMDPCNPRGTSGEDHGGADEGSGSDDEHGCNDEDWDGDGFTENQGDCDDGDATANPDGTETCGDGVDQDCSGSDEACPDTGDTGDTGGDTDTGGTSEACVPTGESDDLVCDGVDDDCDGYVDDSASCAEIYVADLNGDAVNEAHCIRTDAFFTGGTWWEDADGNILGYGAYTFDYLFDSANLVDNGGKVLCDDMTSRSVGDSLFTYVSDLASDGLTDVTAATSVSDFVWAQNQAFCLSGSAAALEFCSPTTADCDGDGAHDAANVDEDGDGVNDGTDCGSDGRADNWFFSVTKAPSGEVTGNGYGS